MTYPLCNIESASYFFQPLWMSDPLVDFLDVHRKEPEEFEKDYAKMDLKVSLSFVMFVPYTLTRFRSSAG